MEEYQVKANEAKAALEADKERRRKECESVLQDIMRRYNCTLQPVLTVLNGQIQHNILIVALD